MEQRGSLMLAYIHSLGAKRINLIPNMRQLLMKIIFDENIYNMHENIYRYHDY